jgi:tetratricopeptide (TPR) repeat protein
MTREQTDAQQFERYAREAFAHFERPDVPVPALAPGWPHGRVAGLVARALTDPPLLKECLASITAQFTALPPAVQDKWYQTELPVFTEEQVLTGGPAALGEADLARLALSGTLLEEWECVLDNSRHPPGEWFMTELLRASSPADVSQSSDVRGAVPPGRSRSRGRRIAEVAAVLAASVVISVVASSFATAQATARDIEDRLAAGNALGGPDDAAQLDEAFQTFEEADQKGAGANLFWRILYTGQRRELDRLRADYELARGLRATHREANRVWLTEGGIRTASESFVKVFRQRGLFKPAAGPAVAVTPDDLARLEAVVAARPAVRRVVLNAVDHWLNILGRSETPGAWADLIQRLRAAAGRIEAGEPSVPTLQAVRQAVAAGDETALANLFLGDSALDDAQLRRMPSALIGQVDRALRDRHASSAAYRVARRIAMVRPTDETVNAILAADSPAPAQASRYARALVTADPDNPVYRSSYGRTLLDAARLSTDRPRSAERNARDRLEFGDIYEAVEHCELAVRLSAAQNRTFALGHYHLGLAYEHSHHWMTGAAVTEFEAAIRDAARPGQSSDHDPVFHYALARALQDLGRDPTLVVGQAEQCLKLYDRWPKPPVVPGQSRPGVADRLWEPGPDEYVWAHVTIGRAYLDLGRASDAVVPLAKAVRLRPQTVYPALWLGKAHFAAGDLGRAITVMRQAHDLDRSDPEVLALLGELSLADGDLKRAGEWFALAKAAPEPHLTASRPAHSLMLKDWLARVDRCEKLSAEVDAYATAGKGLPSVDLGWAAIAGKRYTTAARVLKAHMEANPDPNMVGGDAPRLAIGTAVRAGRAGLLGDADRVAGAETLHATALDWARAELGRFRAAYDQVVQGKGQLARDELLGRMSEYQADHLLAAVRDPVLRGKLGEAERQSWEAFWREWDRLLLKVRELPLPETLSRLGEGGLGGF